jgi:GINS complex subunit 1
MCAEKSRKLLRELKTSMWLPPYNGKLIAEIQEEVKDLSVEGLEHYRALEQMHATTPEFTEEQTSSAAVLSVKNAIIFRHKRCVLSYLQYRTRKLEESRWQTGVKLPSHFQNNLSEEEVKYFNRYSKLLTKYSAISGVDVTRDMDPPKDVQVEVSVNEDIGEVDLPESGAVDMRKNTRMLLRRSEAESLIRQGFVQQTRVG